jgi:hypothetical protein
MTAAVGLKELERKLGALTSVQARKAVRSALMAGAKPIVDQAKRNAGALGSGSGAYALSLGARFEKAVGLAVELKIGARYVVKIGARPKHAPAVALYNLAYKRRVKGIFYGHLLERGFQHVGGKKVGGTPILESALTAMQSLAVQKFTVRLGKAIDKIVQSTK